MASNKNVRESVTQKVARYESELESGFCVKNGKLVPLDKEDVVYRAGYIDEVKASMKAKEKAKEGGENTIYMNDSLGRSRAHVEMANERRFGKRKKTSYAKNNTYQVKNTYTPKKKANSSLTSARKPSNVVPQKNAKSSVVAIYVNE